MINYNHLEYILDLDGYLDIPEPLMHSLEELMEFIRWCNALRANDWDVVQAIGLLEGGNHEYRLKVTARPNSGRGVPNRP